VARLGRPTKPLISKEKATQAALDIIDTHGLDALSLGEVAKKLNVKAPSLYHHFHNKAELLTEVARSILREIDPPRPSNKKPWDESFVELCLETRRAIMNHPNAAPLLLRYFPRSLLLAAYDFWTARCPYPPQFRMVVLDGSEKLTFGSSLYGAAAIARKIPAMPEFPPEKFPTLTEAMDANPYDDEALFEESIRVFLAGLKARYGMESTPQKRKAKVR
jgi:AcrR family transcriptional regulator